jgi:hypothetical protein
MNIMIFDTETTSLEKPFCYNIGYIIVNVDTEERIVSRDFVCEQVWHNPMLFSTAYYANKRDIYVKSMRQRKTKMDKFGYICQQMIRDIKNYGVSSAYAYNSSFDEKVFDFNCDWFKCNNPFDNIPIYDIRGYAHHFLCNDDFKQWCEKYNAFSDSGNYSTTAENMYRFISGIQDFVEEHTALADSEIETEILLTALFAGAEIETDYKAFRSIVRPQKKIFTVKRDKEVIFSEECEAIRYMKTNNTIILKG